MTTPAPPSPHLLELLKFVRAHFGDKLTRNAIRSADDQVVGVLYDAIPFTCGYSGPGPSFGAGIVLADGSTVITIFGEKISLNTDADSIRHSLDQLDDYARTVLPDKYLERFEASRPAAEPGTTLGG